MRGWTTWEDLQDYARFNREFLDSVRGSRDAGRTVDEAVAALNFWERYPAYDRARADANVQAIYDELGSR